MRKNEDEKAIEDILNEKPQPKKRKGRPKRVVVEGQEPEGTKQTLKDPLMEPFYIQMDKYGYSVFEVIQPIDKDSKPYEQSISHHSNFDSCLTSIAKKKMNSKSYSSIKEYVDEYKKLLTSFLKVNNFEFKREK